MVVDMGKVVEGKLDDGALWVMEQLPGRNTRDKIFTHTQPRDLHIQSIYQDMVRGSNISVALLWLLGFLQQSFLS